MGSASCRTSPTVMALMPRTSRTGDGAPPDVRTIRLAAMMTRRSSSGDVTVVKAIGDSVAWVSAAKEQMTAAHPRPKIVPSSATLRAASLVTRPEADTTPAMTTT